MGNETEKVLYFRGVNIKTSDNSSFAKLRRKGLVNSSRNFAKLQDVIRNHKASILKNLEYEIKEVCKKLSQPLEFVSKYGIKSINNFEINCSDLEDYNFIDIRKEEKFSDLFSRLVKIKGPCLYFFEIKSNHSKEEIISKISEYSVSENSKTIPAIKTKVEESRFLYVGKVKKLVWGRLIQHLGFYKVSRTQGLQLYYWAKEVNLDLNFTVIEFENDMMELSFVPDIAPILGYSRL
ncbi:hypothetical protein [Kaistella sp.]|uniref:hypothetical protein n=1 Tax=Kaistella sp. TaxID=2782235 RepID=UPI002F9511B3